MVTFIFLWVWQCSIKFNFFTNKQVGCHLKKLRVLKAFHFEPNQIKDILRYCVVKMGIHTDIFVTSKCFFGKKDDYQVKQYLNGKQLDGKNIIILLLFKMRIYYWRFEPWQKMIWKVNLNLSSSTEQLWKFDDGTKTLQNKSGPWIFQQKNFKIPRPWKSSILDASGGFFESPDVLSIAEEIDIKPGTQVFLEKEDLNNSRQYHSRQFFQRKPIEGSKWFKLIHSKSKLVLSGRGNSLTLEGINKFFIRLQIFNQFFTFW